MNEEGLLQKKIVSHLDMLIEHWRKQPEHEAAKIIVDAYLSLKHNILEHDAFGVEEMRKEFYQWLHSKPEEDGGIADFAVLFEKWFGKPK